MEEAGCVDVACISFSMIDLMEGVETHGAPTDIRACEGGYIDMACMACAVDPQFQMVLVEYEQRDAPIILIPFQRVLHRPLWLDVNAFL